MRQKALILGLLVTIPAMTLFCQSSVAVRGGYKTHNQLAAVAELGISNLVTAYLMPSLTIPSANRVDILALSTGVRLYPFDGGDLGYPGFPTDRSDFGHQLSPYAAIGVQVASASATAEEAADLGLASPTQAVFLASAEIGVRWYVFRTLVLTKALVVDNLFLEVPIGYSLNVSSLTGLFGYGGGLDGEFPSVSLGLCVGTSF